MFVAYALSSSEEQIMTNMLWIIAVKYNFEAGLVLAVFFLIFRMLSYGRRVIVTKYLFCLTYF